MDKASEIGAECAVGVEHVRRPCDAADGLKVCGAVPGLPEEEICDGIDNDCNQAVDDVSLAGTADVDNCGGCNVQCVPEANQVPACEVNAAGGFGCQFDCATGFIDLNREATDGCEYACIITNGGEEVCDGLDNDCDGVVDEGTDEFRYDGPAAEAVVSAAEDSSHVSMVNWKPTVRCPSERRGL